MTSEGYHLFTSDDGDQIIVDYKSGKYYTLSSQKDAGNVKQHYPSSNRGYGYNINKVPFRNDARIRNNIPQTRGNYSPLMSSIQYSNKMEAQDNSNYQQKHQKSAVTNQKNSEQITSRSLQRNTEQAEQTSTPHETEQISDEENEDKNEKELVDQDAHQNDIPAGTKRAFNDSDDFITVGSNKFKKKEFNQNEINEFDDRQQHPPLSSSHINQRETTNGLNHSRISNYALEYASNYHFQPFKLECQPKIHDRKDGTKIINELIQYITSDFLTQNPGFSRDIFFDLWWIDSEGNIQIIIKTTELYIYLCKPDRYPNVLNNVKINPIHPKHLPPQHIILIKWVIKTFTDEDVREELNKKFESLFCAESIVGTFNEKNRHVKVEMMNKNEYNNILNSKKINLGGQLYPVDEYLPSPRILICNRCNLPGHTKKSCRNSDVDLCRRCGKPSTNVQEHKDCETKCHHCEENHIATDYKCKIIDDYRRQLMEELKKHPEKMPPNVQLFIPYGYRSADRRKIIYNDHARQQSTDGQQQLYNRDNYSDWPELRAPKAPIIASDTIINNLNESIKTLSKELQEEKQRHKVAQDQIEKKLKISIQTTKRAWMLIKQMQQTEVAMLSSMNTVLNKVMFPMCAKSTEILNLITNKLETRFRKLELDDITEVLKKQVSYINAAGEEFIHNQNQLNKVSSQQNEAMELIDTLFQSLDE